MTKTRSNIREIAPTQPLNAARAFYHRKFIVISFIIFSMYYRLLASTKVVNGEPNIPIFFTPFVSEASLKWCVTARYVSPQDIATLSRRKAATDERKTR